MKTETYTASDSPVIQKIETIFGDVYVYVYHPALNGQPEESPYLVVDVDTAPGVDRLVKVTVDDEEVFTGEVPA